MKDRDKETGTGTELSWNRYPNPNICLSICLHYNLRPITTAVGYADTLYDYRYYDTARRYDGGERRTRLELSGF